MSFRSLAALGSIASALTLATSASATPCPGTNVITDPADFAWTFHPADANNPAPYYSGTMEVGQQTFNINGYTLTTRAYGQAGQPRTLPGPTMRLVPGNKYVLRFHNKLPFEALNPAENVFRDPNVSNLHTHGLHVSGEAPGDDVTRSFEGQRGGDFVYDVRGDHMGGTFWYHAHHHGSTFLQVAGGAFGLLLVDDGADGIPANVAAMAERQLAIAYLDPGVAGTGGDTLMSGTLPSSWTVNGKLNGNLCVPVNEWQHWRVLLADRNANEKTVTISGCEVKLLARDGVWRTVAPKALATGTVTITGASRADLAVRCPANGTIAVAGATVATIYADGAGNPAPHPFAADGVSTWSIPRPSYLRDLRNETNVHVESVNMGARTVNGASFDHMAPTFTLQANAVQSWSVSGAGRHPFHLHVYHVQTTGCAGDYEDGEYYDVVAGNCGVRFDLNAATSSVYAGRTIMHCHILEHEDQGAMGWSEVLGGASPPTFPADGNLATPYAEYYSLTGTAPAAPSGLTATAASSSRIDLSWIDNSTDEMGFSIERAPDGTSFSPLASVGVGATAYQDGSVSPSTPYWYRVRATNSAGSSAPSNVAVATTPAAQPGTSLTVGSITLSTVNAGGGKKKGQAVVVVKDDQGNLAANATVTGTFTGSFNETVTNGPTGSNGSTTLQTATAKSGTITFTFCVTSITHPTLAPFSGSVCGSL